MTKTKKIVRWIIEMHSSNYGWYEWSDARTQKAAERKAQKILAHSNHWETTKLRVRKQTITLGRIVWREEKKP